MDVSVWKYVPLGLGNLVYPASCPVLLITYDFTLLRVGTYFSWSKLLLDSILFFKAVYSV